MKNRKINYKILALIVSLIIWIFTAMTAIIKLQENKRLLIIALAIIIFCSVLGYALIYFIRKKIKVDKEAENEVFKKLSIGGLLLWSSAMVMIHTVTMLEIPNKIIDMSLNIISVLVFVIVWVYTYRKYLNGNNEKKQEEKKND